MIHSWLSNKSEPHKWKRGILVSIEKVEQYLDSNPRPFDLKAELSTSTPNRTLLFLSWLSFWIKFIIYIRESSGFYKRLEGSDLDINIIKQRGKCLNFLCGGHFCWKAFQRSAWERYYGRKNVEHCLLQRLIRNYWLSLCTYSSIWIIKSMKCK